MNELKNVSFWKSLEIVLASARVPDTQTPRWSPRWSIVRLEGVTDLPARLPTRTAPAERASGSDGAVTPASPGAREGTVARPPPRRYSLGFMPE